MPGSQTTRGPSDTRGHAPERVAFRSTDYVGTPNCIPFAAQWPACTHPCQRFAGHLAVAAA